MEQLIVFIVLMILAAILERISKGARRQAPPPEQGELPLEPGAGEGEAEGRPPMTLEELLAQQFGIRVERRPGAAPSGAPRAPEAGPRPKAPARAAPPPRPRARPEPGREVVLPRRPVRVVVRRETELEPEALPEEAVSLEEQALRVRDEAVSLEERALRARGEAVSLEVERRPEDHEVFRKRYVAPPAPRASLHEVQAQVETTRAPRRSDLALPQRKGWRDAQRAIVWSEILGPPRALRD